MCEMTAGTQNNCYNPFIPSHNLEKHKTMCPPLLLNWTGALPQSWKEVDELVRDLLPCTNLVRDRMCTNLVRDRMTRPLNFVILI